MLSLAVSHRSQHQQADCLAACAAMVLAYIGSPIEYDQLLRLLGIRYYGAAFSNLRNLEALGVSVAITRDNIDGLQGHLGSGSPVIVALNTDALPYWEDDTAHAVVVIGIEHDQVLLNDPAFEQAPQVVPLDAFLIGWIEQDRRCAILSLADVPQNRRQNDY